MKLPVRLFSVSLLGLTLLMGCFGVSASDAASVPMVLKDSHAVWQNAIANAHTPSSGCFHASYPTVSWEAVPCLTQGSSVAAGAIHSNPIRPRSNSASSNVGAGDANDYLLQSSGLITKAVGTFPSVTGVTQVETTSNASLNYAGILGPGNYDLQINTPVYSLTTAACQGHPGCTVWQQYVYNTGIAYKDIQNGDLYPTPNAGTIGIYYWLQVYGRPCPTNWIEWGTDQCWTYSQIAIVPNIPVSQLANVTMTGTAAVNGNDTMILSVGSDAYSVTAPDSVLDIATVWNAAEFNIVGACCAAGVTFNTGSSVTVNLAVENGSTAAPGCSMAGAGTAEYNNLYLGECFTQGGAMPSIQFTESNVGSNLADTSMVISSNLNPAKFGQIVGLTATVAGNAPTGTVAFVSAATVLCTAQIAFVNGQYQASCNALAGTPGLTDRPNYIQANYEGDGQNQPSATTWFTQTVTAAGSININQQGLTGAWGRSNTPGTSQGFLFDILEDNVSPGHGTAFAGWYTYDLAGGSGGQRWYALQGDVYTNARSATLGIYTATDGDLNSGTKPPIVQVGTATVSFSDCSTGILIYTFNDLRSGSIPISRVGQNSTCMTGGGPRPAPANSLLSGAWTVPNAVGMGFVIDIIPSQTTLFGSWYTFAAPGSSAPSPRQQWFVFQDSNFSSTQTGSNNLDLLQTNGGTFDATVGGGVATSTVGKVSINFTSCTTGTLTYSIPSQSVSQTTVPLVRLGPAPAGCSL